VSRIFWDTNLFIYLFEKNAEFLKPTQALRNRMIERGDELITSTMTLAEVQELQTRLTKAGYDTGGTDGRVGNDTMKAVRDYQTKMGLLPADGYGGLKVLARLRQGG